MQQELVTLEQQLQQTLLNTDINAAQQLEQQLQDLSAKLADADVANRASLAKGISQLQQRLAQLPLLAEQLAQLTRIVADWAALTAPTTAEQYQQHTTQLTLWQQEWRRLTKAMVIAVPASLLEAKTALSQQWQDLAKSFDAESEKIQRQCRSKLAQYRRLYNAGKYKVLFGLFKGIEEDYQQLTEQQRAQLSKDYEFARDKMTAGRLAGIYCHTA